VAEWNPQAARMLFERARRANPASPSTPPGMQVPNQRRTGPTIPRTSFPGASTTGTPWTASRLPHQNAPPAANPPQWQRDELRVLARLYYRGALRDALRDARAQAYLAARNIPLWVAHRTGMGYLPPYQELPQALRWDGALQTPSWWCHRLIFPVGIAWPDGTTRLGFCGRTLEGWQPGMSEEEHKRLLAGEGSPRRWRKTWPGGWFGYEPERLGAWVILVEGPFDRCALLAAGFAPHEVIALVGTAARIGWLPRRVETLVIALDADTGGEAAAEQIAALAQRDGRNAQISLPPRDGNGKDWSERWEKRGLRGLLPLLEERRRLNLLQS
jgi:hypothetical protein